jgi:hypothetical protein
LLSIKEALGELDLKLSDQNPYVLAGIIRRNNTVIRKDITAGAAALIPPILAQGAAQVIGSFGAVAGPAVASSVERRLPLTGTTTPYGRSSDRSALLFLDRMGRIAVECMLRALLALAKEQSKPKTPNRERGRLSAGRHRKPFEPVTATTSNLTKDAAAGQEPDLAGVVRSAT